jgi:hypothetical protein
LEDLSAPLEAKGCRRSRPPKLSKHASRTAVDTAAESAADSAIDAAAPLQSSKNPTPAAADAAAPALALKPQDRAAQDLDADEPWTPPFRVDFEVCTNYLIDALKEHGFSATTALVSVSNAFWSRQERAISAAIQS